MTKRSELGRRHAGIGLEGTAEVRAVAKTTAHGNFCNGAMRERRGMQLPHTELQPALLDEAAQRLVSPCKGVVQMPTAAIECFGHLIDRQPGVAHMAGHMLADAVVQGLLLRHRRGLPVRGQRTKTNARTRKGPRKPIRK